MKKFILIMFSLFNILFIIPKTVNAQNNSIFYHYKVGHAENSPNCFNFGYSYSTNNLHDIWMSVMGGEFSICIPNNSTNIPDSYSTHGDTRWSHHKLSGYWGAKMGYQFNSYISGGISCSFRCDELDYENGYCTIHHETHEWINGHSSTTEDFGWGIYAKITLPIRYVSPFIVGQLHTNGNNTIGIGLMFNVGNIK